MRGLLCLVMAVCAILLLMPPEVQADDIVISDNTVPVLFVAADCPGGACRLALPLVHRVVNREVRIERSVLVQRDVREGIVLRRQPVRAVLRRGTVRPRVIVH